jgi:hypothetical protein
MIEGLHVGSLEPGGIERLPDPQLRYAESRPSPVAAPCCIASSATAATRETA